MTVSLTLASSLLNRRISDVIVGIGYRPSCVDVVVLPPLTIAVSSPKLADRDDSPTCCLISSICMSMLSGKRVFFLNCECVYMMTGTPPVKQVGRPCGGQSSGAEM